MSKRRKQQEALERKQKARMAILVSLSLIVLALAIGYGIWWQFLRIKPTSAFLPRDPVSVVFVNIDSDSSQVKAVKDLGEVFGSREFFPGVLQDILLPLGDQYVEFDKEEIKLWFGDTVAIAKVRVADRPIDMIVIEIDNQEKAKEFTDTLKENLGSKGRAVSEEVFRGHVITSIEGGTNPIHFTLLPNHILVSERVDGVRMMLDTERGRVPSLETDKEFRRAQNRVKDESESILFFVVDVIEVIRLLPNLTSQLDPQLVAGLLSRGTSLNLYGTFEAQNDGAYLNAFLGDDLSEERPPELKPRFAELLPSDTLLMIESSSIRHTLEGVLFEDVDGSLAGEEQRAALSYLLRTEYDLSYEDDIMAMMEGPYAFSVLPSTFENKAQLALMIDLDEDEDTAGTIGKMEQALVRIMNEQYPSEDGREAAFTTHRFGNDSYRFLNLPDDINLDLAVKQIDDVLILATSDEAMESILTAQQLPEDARLANHPPYRITLEDVERSDMTRIVYVDTQNFLRFSSDLNALDYATLRDDYKVPDEFVGVSWSERVGSTTRGFLNIF